jgi:hypothetical protein
MRWLELIEEGLKNMGTRVLEMQVTGTKTEEKGGEEEA